MEKLKIDLYGLSRRDFIRISTLSAAGMLMGCATNPVTGKSQLMLVSEEKEIDIDRMHSPHQISADYGATQDQGLNQYIEQTGKTMAAKTHRPHMPYRFRAVNATYINAYAFPGGTIAITRGILLELDNEAELAALVGHELGHVNARHTAEIMSKGMITQAVVGGIAVIAGTQDPQYGGIAAQVGMIGSGALLASYSRDNERQADNLGLEYMVESGYGPDGMVGLMDMLKSMSKHKMSATQMLFSTHPMSDERHKTAVNTVRNKYASAKNQPLHRERYKDKTAGLRKIRGAIKNLQKGDAAMAQKKYSVAESLFAKALKQAPNDYAGLIMMSKAQLAQKKYKKANRYTEKAKKIYPQEAQAYIFDGYLKLQLKDYETALRDFNAYDKRLPGNPHVTFFKGLSNEGMDRIPPAAKEYNKFLKVVREGEEAQYAYQRLVEWGYVK